MCRTTAHRFTCGHTHAHYVSPCRLTYSSPTTGNPLCSTSAAASPDLTVRIQNKCHNCRYDHFVARWQSRIAEVTERCEHLRMLMSEYGSSSCSELDDGWGPESGEWGPPAPTPGLDALEPHIFCDAEDAQERVKQEYAALRCQVQRLWVQFEHEEATEYVGFAAARLGDIRGQRGEMLRRKRSVRHVRSCVAKSSPLRNVTVAADLDEATSPVRPLTFPFPAHLRRWDEGSAVLDSDSESGDDTRVSRAGSTDSSSSAESRSTLVGSVFSDDDDSQPWAEKRWDEAEAVFEMDDEELSCDEDEVGPKDAANPSRGRPGLHRAHAYSAGDPEPDAEPTDTKVKPKLTPLSTPTSSPATWSDYKSSPSTSVHSATPRPGVTTPSSPAGGIARWKRPGATRRRKLICLTMDSDSRVF